ncbi:MAG: retroviral-like aspartic protease family protein [Bacteroidetes bacterium]|nr:retroviral-like aspartic protease family protein [Bacteroidota bacterium]
MKNILTFCLIIFLSSNIFAQVIAFAENENGLFFLPCKVNGLKLDFILDSGASDLCISSTEAIFMLKNGYLYSDDIQGSSFAKIASGEIMENTKITISLIEFFGMKIHNIDAHIVHNLSAPLLMGTSVISRLGTVTIEGNKLSIKGYPIEKEIILLNHSIKDQIIAYYYDNYNGDDMKVSESENDSIIDLSFYHLPELSFERVVFIPTRSNLNLFGTNPILLGNINNNYFDELIVTVHNEYGASSYNNDIFIFEFVDYSYELAAVYDAREIAGCERGSFIINFIKNNFIFGISDCYDEDDANCCPSLKYETILGYKDKKIFHISSSPIKQ